MTTPTPTQIEAILADYLGPVQSQKAANRIAALSAAAEVGNRRQAFHDQCGTGAAAEVGDTEIDRLHGIIKDMDGAIDKLEHEKAVLTTAAGVGEPLDVDGKREAWRDLGPSIINATIERCARVAERYANYGGGIGNSIAVAIRKLKDET